MSPAWLRKQGITAIPKASSVDHLHDNWASLSLQLDEGEFECIDGLNEGRRIVDPGFGPWNR